MALSRKPPSRHRHDTAFTDRIRAPRAAPGGRYRRATSSPPALSIHPEPGRTGFAEFAPDESVSALIARADSEMIVPPPRVTASALERVRTEALNRDEDGECEQDDVGR
jgi:hypothetical protein